MSNLNKISLLLGSLGLGFSSLTMATTDPQADTTEYFEDSSDFETVAAESKDGWGWSTPQSACPYGDTRCDSTGTISEPTPIKPRSVANIYVKYKQDSGSVTLTWPSTSTGNGTSFRYEVYQQPKGGSLSRIYSGTGRSKSHYAGSNKTIRYAVRACSSAGCSGYEYSNYFLINPTYDNDGIYTKPLSEVTQLATIANQKTMTTASSEEDTALSVLGAGFEALRGEVYSSHCWATSGNNVVDSVEYVNDQVYSFSQVDTYTQLAQTLDIKRSGGLNLSFSGFSFGGSGSYSLYSQTEKVTDTSVIVASFVDKQNKYKAKQASTLQMASDKKSMLENGYKKEFRKHCGDKYIDSVTTGRRINFTIRIESVTESNAVTKTKTAQLKASLDSYGADGNFDTSERNEIKESFKNYTFDIKGAQVGASSSSNLLQLNDIGEFMTVLENFANSTSDALVNIESTEKDYPIPSSMLGQAHFNVFEDYTVQRDKLTVWGNLDSQLYQRCWMLDADKVGTDALKEFEIAFGSNSYNNNESEVNLCQAVKTMVNNNVNYCLNQGEWAKCHQPLASSCYDTVNSSQCMTRAERISYKSPDKASARLDVARGGCTIGPCYEDKRVEACFTSADSVPDFSRNDVISSSYHPAEVSGLVAIVERSWNVDRASNSVFKNSTGKYCFSAFAKVYGQGGWGSGGRYESNNIMWGFYPRSLNYSL